ncbi:arylamine N-acetyltransferase family protein [Streptomyces sp. NBC_00316]|uniref:arylamine N-acetyltransferase family protein n=1 Tax=Streptomyces sp. NBC_00316 TaxID=2975710 RepID=UPI002E2B0DAC|nr:arylamine N-acetyltransferase [Streptomyces sp. NBC_00316]
MPFESFVEPYLLRLGLSLDKHRTPSAAGLRALHRAHIERVPWETLEVHLGRPTTVDPHEAIVRILRGRGGCCHHLNGAFATLLTALGYDVTWHRGGVQSDTDSQPPGATGGHLVLTVDCDGQTWVVDVGFGEALYEPMPLRAGSYRQGPFTYRLRPSQVEPGGWRFDHDERGDFAGMDFTLEPAAPADFAEQHAATFTSPDSRLVRIASVMRRRANGVDHLRGCVLSSTDGTDRTQRALTTADDWFGALAGTFGITLAEIDPAERTALWEKVRAAHTAWQASRAEQSA